MKKLLTILVVLMLLAPYFETNHAKAYSGDPATNTFTTKLIANCRKGPGLSYKILTTIKKGTTVTVYGRNSDYTWWQVEAGITRPCWVSNTTGTFNGDMSTVPFQTWDPLTDTIAPKLFGRIQVQTTLSYPDTCGATMLNVAIKAQENSLYYPGTWEPFQGVILKYRYVANGYRYIGGWHEMLPNDSAMGGLNGYSFDISEEASAELGTYSGMLQYYFVAIDAAGNISSSPYRTSYKIPIKYCGE